jgi:hypothetical protein
VASPPVTAESMATKRANRDMPVYQAAEQRSERPDKVCFPRLCRASLAKE